MIIFVSQVYGWALQRSQKNRFKTSWVSLRVSRNYVRNLWSAQCCFELKLLLVQWNPNCSIITWSGNFHINDDKKCNFRLFVFSNKDRLRVLEMRLTPQMRLTCRCLLAAIFVSYSPGSPVKLFEARIFRLSFRNLLISMVVFKPIHQYPLRQLNLPWQHIWSKYTT